jgi:uncharacterized protein YdhG (YjbR/CyaY superfamily)
MWQCPKCGREFKNTGQDHYCGKIETIDQYILEQPAEIQTILNKIRETIRLAAPDATERISWRMPTFWQGENLVHFAAFKKHIGFYPGRMGEQFRASGTTSPGGEAAGVFAERLTDYKTSKGSIQLPLSKPIDYELITDITKWRVHCVESNGVKIVMYEIGMCKK